MPEQPQMPELNVPDPAEFSKNMLKVAEQSQKLVAEFMQKQSENPGQDPDPLNISKSFLEMTEAMMSNPEKIIQAQMNLWQDYMNLWQQSALKMTGQETETVIEPERGDKRFRDSEWQENQVFDFIKQSYLLTARWMTPSPQVILS
jgi:polyhydroxyalkanoate synthase